MLSELRVHLATKIPVVGCELTPYVLRASDNTLYPDDNPQSSPVHGHFLGYKWYRIQSDNKPVTCSVHPSEQATLQCTGCVKANIPFPKSYHCSPKCFSDAWQHHRVLHERAAIATSENRNEEDELFGRPNSSGAGTVNSLSGSLSSSRLTNGSAPLYPSTAAHQNNGEALIEVGRSKTYTPTPDDIGHKLRLDCIVLDTKTKLPIGKPYTSLTNHVIPAPSPVPRRLITVNGVDVLGHSGPDFHPSSGNFTVLSYNILADRYASDELYGYCPSWALSWPYRRQNLLREIVTYQADIVCLQEVQSNHFEEFFAPELDKHGYEALYKRRTNEVYTGKNELIDGCATFFRRDRFSNVKKYEVEFNKAAQSLTEAIVPSTQKKAALNRMVKDNVALIAVLESKIGYGGDNLGKRQLLCVANTHINVHHDLKDVKLWQMHTLLKGLEKIAVSADIPMLVCGDFNSVPGSASHCLVAMGKVDPAHVDLTVDPLGILRPLSKLSHQLPLVSAYSSFARVGGTPILEQQKMRMDTTTNEPLFTNCTRDFIGTLDYIFYTADTLTVETLLELLDEESLRKNTALPSQEWSSDHIALLAEFKCKPRSR
ncbi:hypothetical protein MLD38_021411 [Melastoma candidum]|uniref:Uncharacterized protein n=1 Tax=Melastoma candidum TaxID=119954 RepID=A0ACB9QHV0_9MYRT|nr:hypothetical protein MLD38_021411 [Melastoma candidum]